MAAKKTTKSPLVYTVVVGVDATSASDVLVAEAIAAASARLGATVHAVHGLDAPGGGRSASDIRRVDAVLDRGAKALKTYLGKTPSIINAQGRKITGHVRMAAPAKAILQVAIDLDADLIVVGETQRAGLSKLLHKATSATMLAKAPCSVLVVRAREARPKSPRIERACPKCVAVRASTDQAEWWCPVHAKKSSPLPMHVFHYGGGDAFRTSTPIGGH